MHFLTKVTITAVALGIVQSGLAQPMTSYASFYCLDPSGNEFNIVGPVNTWYSRAERAFIASPHSQADACVYVTKLCNSTYHEVCHGDCLAGHSVTYLGEQSCTNSTPLSPASSEPEVRHEVWFIKSSIPAAAPPPIPENFRQIYYPR